MRTGLKSIKQKPRIESVCNWGMSKYGHDNFTQHDFELMTFGGEIKRTVIRTSFADNSEETISFDRATYELSGFAGLLPSEGSEFAKYRGYQIRKLILIDYLFYCPWFNGAVAELFDAGCQILTTKASYRLGTQEVIKATDMDMAKAIGRVTRWEN